MYPKDEVKEKEMLFETQKRGLKMLESVIKRERNVVIANSCSEILHILRMVNASS